MKHAAIGVRMHSGWGALVAVSNNAGAVEVIERRRIAVTASGAAGANQPYHFAERLELPEAEKFLGSCFEASKCLALAAVQEVVGELRSSQYRLVGSAILMASGRPLPPLAKILASHALIHAAEGEFFREVFTKAGEVSTFPSPGFESEISTNASGRRSAEGRPAFSNKFLLLVVLSDRPGPKIRNPQLWLHW